MKMAKGFKRIAVGLLAAIIAAASFVGCGGTSSNDNRNITMDVASAVTVEVGSEYRVPSVFAYDGANDYAAVFTVKNGDKEIAVSNGKFTAQLMSDYTITYYADCGNGKSITKTTVVKVKDETAPVISFGTIVKGASGKRYVPDFVVSDNSGKAEVTMTVKYEDGSDVVVTDNGFTPAKEGRYTVTVTATDAAGNSSADSVTVQIGEAFITAVAQDLETQLFVYRSGASEVAIGEAGKTEGIVEGGKSFKINVASSEQWPSYSLDPELARAIVKIYDAIEVDVYTSGAAHAHKISTGNKWESDMVLVQPATWTTLTFTKEAINGYMDDDDQWRLLNNGNECNENFTIYFDNARGVIQSRTVIIGDTIDFSDKFAEITAEFENSEITDFNVKDSAGNLVTEGVDASAYSFATSALGDYTVSATLRKENYRDVVLSIVVSVEKPNMYPAGEHRDGECAEGVFRGDVQESVMSVNTNRSFVREGNKSICYYVNLFKGYPCYYIDANSAYVNGLLDSYDAIAFDVYIDGANSHDLCAGKGKDTPRTMRVAPKTWTTVTMSKEIFTAYNGQRVVYNDGGDNEEFRLYIDNLRGIKLYKDESAVGEAFDLTERINAIKTSLGADSATIEVKTAGGVAVTDGINGLIFTPSAEGEYIITVTFVKENYNDYTAEYSLLVHQAGYLKDAECAEGVMRQAAGSALSVNTDLKFIREGDKSICYTVNINEGYPTYFIDAESAYIKGLLEKYNAISFDVYIDGVKSHDLCVGTGKDVKRKAIAPKTWTTITLSKEVLAAYNGERMFFNDGGSNEGFRLYIDNICGVNV